MGAVGARGGGGGANMNAKGVVNNLGVRKLPFQYLAVEKASLSPRGGASPSPKSARKSARSQSVDMSVSIEDASRDERQKSYEVGREGFGVRDRKNDLLTEEDRRLAYPRKLSDDNIALVGNREANLETTATAFFKNKALVKEQIQFEGRQKEVEEIKPTNKNDAVKFDDALPGLDPKRKATRILEPTSAVDTGPPTVSAFTQPMNSRATNPMESRANAPLHGPPGQHLPTI